MTIAGFRIRLRFPSSCWMLMASATAHWRRMIIHTE